MGRLAGRQTDRCVDGLTRLGGPDRQTVRQADRQAERQVDRQADGRAGGQVGRAHLQPLHAALELGDVPDEAEAAAHRGQRVGDLRQVGARKDVVDALEQRGKLGRLLRKGGGGMDAK
jgi:hypothetical protein